MTVCDNSCFFSKINDPTHLLKVKLTRNTSLVFSFLNCCGFNLSFGGICSRRSREEEEGDTGIANNSSQPHTNINPASDDLETEADNVYYYLLSP